MPVLCNMLTSAQEEPRTQPRAGVENVCRYHVHTHNMHLSLSESVCVSLHVCNLCLFCALQDFLTYLSKLKHLSYAE